MKIFFNMIYIYLSIFTNQSKIQACFQFQHISTSLLFLNVYIGRLHI